MKGKSSAHQQMPITGTQISSCLRKNLSMGMRRLRLCCRARMATQLWWLLVTRYQPSWSSWSRPWTTHSVRPARRIQPLLNAIQLSAMRIITRVRKRCQAGMGSSALSSEQGSSRLNQNRVLRISSSSEIAPRTGAGRKNSIVWQLTGGHGGLVVVTFRPPPLSRSVLGIGLYGSQCDCKHDVVHQGTPGQVVHRFAQALQHGSHADHVGAALYRLVGGVAGVQVGEDEDRGLARDQTVRCLLLADAGNRGGIILERPVDQQSRLALARQLGGLAHLLDILAGAGAAG